MKIKIMLTKCLIGILNLKIGKKDLEALEKQANESATALQSIAAKGEKLKTVGDNISNVGEGSACHSKAELLSGYQLYRT